MENEKGQTLEKYGDAKTTTKIKQKEKFEL